MDHYAATLSAALSVYVQASKATGRTTALVKSTKMGDWIVCPSRQVALHVEHTCRDLFGPVHGRHTTVVQADTLLLEGLDSLKAKIKPEQRVLFEHTWIEMFYAEQLKLSSVCFKRISDDLNSREHQQPERQYYVQTPTR